MTILEIVPLKSVSFTNCIKKCFIENCVFQKEPQPFEPSNDVINQKFGRRGSMACQQDLLITKIMVGTENCLHLSVFTRDIQPSTLIPVIVYIHGGAFIYGSNSKDMFNPEFLLRENVVLIAINYRLGALGKFLEIN